MPVFNNSSSPVASCQNQTNFVLLPHSDKLLSRQDIDKKITKIEGHISKLSAAQAHRRTHGSKGFRSRQISLQAQIDTSNERMAMLKLAKDLLRDPDPLPGSWYSFIRGIFGVNRIDSK